MCWRIIYFMVAIMPLTYRLWSTHWKKSGRSKWRQGSLGCLNPLVVSLWAYQSQYQFQASCHQHRVVLKLKLDNALCGMPWVHVSGKAKSGSRQWVISWRIDYPVWHHLFLELEKEIFKRACQYIYLAEIWSCKFVIFCLPHGRESCLNIAPEKISLKIGGYILFILW